MAQTITTKLPENTLRLATGRYLDTGTVAAYSFTTGFKPRYVRIINSAATGGVLEWSEGMADASAFKYLSADGVGALITSLGITVSDYGFTMGLDTDINVTSEQVSWLAIG